MGTLCANKAPCVACVRFVKIALDVSSSADCAAAGIPVSRHSDVRSATSTSTADLFVSECSWILLRTTHSASRFQFYPKIRVFLRYRRSAQRRYRWEKSPEKLHQLRRTCSHPRVIPTLQQFLSPNSVRTKY